MTRKASDSVQPFYDPAGSPQSPYGGLDSDYEPEVAESDFFIPLPELGPHVAVQVKKGTEIPREHLGKPRVSSWPAPPARRALPGV